MIDIDKLNTLWNTINVNSFITAKNIFEKNAGALTEFLIDKILDNDKFEIGLFEDGWQSGSNLIYEDKQVQKRLELRFKKNSAFELILFLENIDGRKNVCKSELSSEEVKLIPLHIRELMYKVREISLPMSFYNTMN